MKNAFLVGLVMLISFFSCTEDNKHIDRKADYVRNVDPMIGTDGFGHTFPGVVLPHGMVQLSPDTDVFGWDRCAGYHYSDSTIVGFSHTHFSGTGVGDLGDIMIMPAVGSLNHKRGTSDNPEEGYRSRFSHNEEIAEVGYYAVRLKDYDIQAELTATQRVGFHRYTFPETDSAHVFLDFTHSIRGETKWAMLRMLDDSTAVGYRINNGWAWTRTTYFAIRFSKPFLPIDNKRPVDAHEKLGRFFKFSFKDKEELLVKVAISPVSTRNAVDNMEEEIPGWDFDYVVKRAKNAWEQEISKIVIDADEKTKRIFYTALYHAHIHPSLYMDNNGQYHGVDQQSHYAEGFTNYTVFSLWDTYRALHPLMTIIDKKRTKDYINSMLAHYDQSADGVLPVWSFHGWETWCMIGYHAVPVIADAILKEIDGFDYSHAFDAMLASSNKLSYDGIGDYLSYGYVPAHHREPVSKTLEYAFDDWAIAQVAEKLDRKEQYEIYLERANNFINLFDTGTYFMRAKDTLGNWTTRNPGGEFDPFYSSHGHDYTEGNAWQYSWYVPHDIYKLIDLMGGKEAFCQRLDSLFMLKPEVNKEAPKDISGLIGQYAHGNEPSHHISYLYSYAGKPWKTQEKVYEILKTMYDDSPDGLAGNEDCGQMSAWYIFSALGFYPVNPVGGVYVFGVPLIEDATIHLENGKQFRIRVKGEGKYVSKIILDGKRYDELYITHNDIMKGKELIFHLTEEPNKERCINKTIPVSQYNSF